MKVSGILTIAVCAATAVASSSPLSTFFSHDSAQKPLVDDGHKVSGENPLYFCEDPANNLLTVDNVDLLPNPPQAGKNLTITASGKLKEMIGAGSKVNILVKYGVITLIRQEDDLCELVTNVDLACPLEKGNLKLSKEVALPSVIPPGTYTVQADVMTRERKKITCLTAKVTFSRS